MAAITLREVTKRYPGGAVGVDRVSLEIADGELLILVGPSGCGKSTLLRMIAGLEEMSSGELLIGGARANDLSPRERGLAMVFQSYALYPHLTVAENIAFPLRIARRPEEEIRRRVQETARLLDLGDLLARRPAQLSGGQRQRVAMGRAIVRDARAFLFDEPLSNLDAKLRGQMRVEISRLQRRLGVTTVYVTHDQTEALTLGDRVAVLRRGALQQVATPRELYERPVNLFVAGFIGAPPMNLVAARVEGGALVLPFARAPLAPERARHLDGRALVAGLRPEHFEDAALVGAEARPRGVTFRAAVEVTEWLGSEQFAYLPLPPAGADGALSGRAREHGAELSTAQLVASIDPASRLRRGAEAELWFEPSRVLLFDAESGARLD